jgi:tetratricopeptide (TPR) repeat protein
MHQSSGASVTILPPSAEDVLSPLSAQIDDLARELASPEAGADQGVSLKQRIFLLHRAIEQHARVIESLQGDVKSLVEGWKGRFLNAGDQSDPMRASANVAAVTAVPGAGTASSAALASTASVAATAIDRVEGTSTDSDAKVSAANSQPATFEAVIAAAAPASKHASEAPLPDAAAPSAPVVESTAVVTAAVRSHMSAPVAGQPRVIDELNASTFVEKGWSRIATGNFAGAEESLDRALELNPGDPHAETLLGWAHMGQGRLDSAMTMFGAVLERHPDHALAHVNTAYIHLKRGAYAEAQDHLSRAIRADSDRKATLYAHYYRGLVHFEQSEYDEAIASLAKTIELGPNLIEARFELGRVFWFADRMDEAKATWQKGAELNKFNPWSARCREMLATIADGGAPSRSA